MAVLGFASFLPLLPKGGSPFEYGFTYYAPRALGINQNEAFTSLGINRGTGNAIDIHIDLTFKRARFDCYTNTQLGTSTLHLKTESTLGLEIFTIPTLVTGVVEVEEDSDLDKGLAHSIRLFGTGNSGVASLKGQIEVFMK